MVANAFLPFHNLANPDSRLYNWRNFVTDLISHKPASSGAKVFAQEIKNARHCRKRRLMVF